MMGSEVWTQIQVLWERREKPSEDVRYPHHHQQSRIHSQRNSCRGLQILPCNPLVLGDSQRMGSEVSIVEARMANVAVVKS